MHIEEYVDSNILFWLLNDFNTVLNSDCPILFFVFGESLKGINAEDILLVTFLIAAWLTKMPSEDDLLLHVYLEGKVTHYYKCYLFWLELKKKDIL